MQGGMRNKWEGERERERGERERVRCEKIKDRKGSIEWKDWLTEVKTKEEERF